MNAHRTPAEIAGARRLIEKQDTDRLRRILAEPINPTPATDPAQTARNEEFYALVREELDRRSHRTEVTHD